MKIFAPVALAVFLCSYFIATADPLYIPFPKLVQDTILRIDTASAFFIDPAEERAFFQKKDKPTNEKYLDNSAREKIYHESILKFQDFLKSQHRNIIALTDSQKSELKSILLTADNYSNSLFCASENIVCALDAQSKEVSLTIVFRQSVITILVKDEQTNAMLNDTGRGRLQQWIRSLRVAENRSNKD